MCVGDRTELFLCCYPNHHRHHHTPHTSSMKDAPLSTNERRFILQCLEHDHRVDGRRFFDFRDISISFGMRWRARCARLLSLLNR